jgi:hypothetical protein
MSTTTMRGIKNRKAASGATQNVLNVQTLMAAVADFDVRIYGGGGSPLYDLVSLYGEVEIIHSIDAAFESFPEARAGLQDGEAGYLFSQEYNRYTLAIKVPQSGIVFAGLLHDGNGTPVVAAKLTLARIKANRDFEHEGETIITKGQEFLKALPAEYVSRLKKVA